MQNIIITASYVGAQILADIGALKIISVLGFPMGTGGLIYPLTFTLRDLAHKTLGKKGVRLLILVAGAINLFMAAFFWLGSSLPGDPAVGPQIEFGLVLSPAWRIVLASILAELLAQLADTEIYQLWLERVTRRYQWGRVLFTNLISIPLDTALFCWAAFGGRFASGVVWRMIMGGLVLKYVIAGLGLPLIYVVKEQNVRIRA